MHSITVYSCWEVLDPSVGSVVGVNHVLQAACIGRAGYNRIKWAAALCLCPLKSFRRTASFNVSVCLSQWVLSDWVPGTIPPTLTATLREGNLSCSLQTGAKIQEMVLNNMGVTYPPLCLSSRSLHHQSSSMWSTAGSLQEPGHTHPQETTVIYQLQFSRFLKGNSCRAWKGERGGIVVTMTIYSKILKLLCRWAIMKPLL